MKFPAEKLGVQYSEKVQYSSWCQKSVKVKIAVDMFQSISCTRPILYISYIFLCFSTPLSTQSQRRGEQWHRGGDEDRQGQWRGRSPQQKADHRTGETNGHRHQGVKGSWTKPPVNLYCCTPVSDEIEPDTLSSSGWLTGFSIHECDSWCYRLMACRDKSRSTDGVVDKNKAIPDLNGLLT